MTNGGEEVTCSGLTNLCQETTPQILQKIREIDTRAKRIGKKATGDIYDRRAPPALCGSVEDGMEMSSSGRIVRMLLASELDGPSGATLARTAAGKKP